jgi:hypothetical protein
MGCEVWGSGGACLGCWFLVVDLVPRGEWTAGRASMLVGGVEE